eukprot:gene31723-60461_t
MWSPALDGCGVNAAQTAYRRAVPRAAPSRHHRALSHRVLTAPPPLFG